jgi:succinoglycan biosynthesis protein ExoV
MKMYFYRGRRTNFGDELNPWLWPRVLPGFFDDDERSLFLGIGSILYDFLPVEPAKIVFGAGYGGYTAVPRLDDRWAFYFVRGRLTAERLGLDPMLGIGDSAILIRSCEVPRPVPRYAASFMPHWESAIDGSWEGAARAAGLHYIDPCGPVETVLDDILRSTVIVTEAMHGAIVADALRVPWVAVKPLQPAHRWKWQDWASALDLDLQYAPLRPSNALELSLAFVSGNKQRAKRLRGRPRLRTLLGDRFRDWAARSLQRAAARDPQLSHDTAIDRAHSRMLEQLARLRRDYPSAA